MHPILGGFLVLVLGASAAAADKSPATPEHQYHDLLKQYNAAFQIYSKTYGEAKTPQERQKVVQEKYPRPDKYALKLLELVEKNPKEPFAEEALIWIMVGDARLAQFRPWYEHQARYEHIWIMTSGGRQFGVPTKEEREVRSRAIDMLLRDHVASPKLGRVVEMLVNNQDKKSNTLLRAIRDKNPSREVRAEAAVALARQMQSRVATVKQIKDNRQTAKSIEQNYGKDYAEELQKADLAKLEAEAEKLYAELAEKYLPDLKPPAVALLCQQLFYTHENDAILRTLYAKGKRDDIRGVACLTLAQVLMHRADGLAVGNAKAAEKLRKESEQLLEEAAEKYGEVKTAFDGPVGTKAKHELFDVRHLAVGKPAPEVEGVDQDGKHFKLSDYKGKVVLLDFWSEF